MFKKNKLQCLNLGLFLENSIYLQPFMLFFYFANNLTVGDYLLFQSISYISYMVLGLAFAYVADHFSKRTMILFGCMLNLLRLLLFILFDGYYIVLAGELLSVFVRLCVLNMADVYVGEYLTQQKNKKRLLDYSGNIHAFMSWGNGFAVLISPLLYYYGGITLILVVELTFALFGFLFLWQVPTTKIKSTTKKYFNEFISGIKYLFGDINLKGLVIYNLMLYATTTVFVALFQPIMERTNVVAFMFGIMFFINHTLRGFSGQLVKNLFTKIKPVNILCFNSVMVLVSFMLMAWAFQANNSVLTIGVLLFVCISVALQFSNQIFVVANINKVAPQKVRTTSIYLVNMLYRGFGGVCLAIFKNMAEGEVFGRTLLLFCAGFAIIFVAGFISYLRPIKKKNKSII